MGQKKNKQDEKGLNTLGTLCILAMVVGAFVQIWVPGFTGVKVVLSAAVVFVMLVFVHMGLEDA